jgi:hypothetical protein
MARHPTTRHAGLVRTQGAIRTTRRLKPGLHTVASAQRIWSRRERILAISAFEIAQHLAIAFLGGAEGFESRFLEGGIQTLMAYDQHPVAGDQEGENGFFEFNKTLLFLMQLRDFRRFTPSIDYFFDLFGVGVVAQIGGR